MRAWLAVWRQASRCESDACIGCGIAIHFFEAEDVLAASSHVVEELSSPTLACEIADTIDQVVVYQLAGLSATIGGPSPAVALMPGAWLAVRRGRIEAANRAVLEAEHAEYLRLKKKFES